jgi:hypothetical protein
MDDLLASSPKVTLWDLLLPVCVCEDGSVIYNRCWSSPAQTVSVLSPTGLLTIFYILRLMNSKNIYLQEKCTFLPEIEESCVKPS